MANSRMFRRMPAHRRLIISLSMMALTVPLTQHVSAASTDPQNYPAAWSSIKTIPLQHGCPNLAGTFSNRADAAFPEDAGAAPTLSDLFTAVGNMSTHELRGSWGPIGNSAAVSISQAAGELAVVFVRDGGAQTRLALQRWTIGKAYSPQRGDFFVCMSSAGAPRLVLISTVDDHNPIPPNTVGTQLMLLRAADGSLIVQLRSNSYEVIDLGGIGGPMVHHSSVWYRYPPATGAVSATTP
jgi:hypothetical protein